jgi:Tfp pilus assembly protein PilZ
MGFMGNRERRRYKRLAIKIPITWDGEGLKKRNIADAFLFDTHDLTTRGLFLKTPLRPKRGSHINLTIKLDRRSKPIRLKGKIRWIAKKREHSYLYPGIGIEFKDVSLKDRRNLNAFIKNKLSNFRDARELKNMYLKLKNMASRLIELEERHSSATRFKKVLDNAIREIDDVAHILDREINEIKKM